MSNAIRETLDKRPMGSFQCMVIGLCFLINMLDGFDVLVMAFTAASVSKEWGLSGSQLGYLLSAGLVGMALGSLFIAPWADRFGRRPLILICICVAGLGMVASSFAPSPEVLGLLRLITGLGIGGILASSYVIAGEYASKRWRGLAIALQSTAYALGATIGGLIATQLIPSMGWRSVFLYGGFATLATLVVLIPLLPESIDFLLSRQPRRALERVNTLIRRIGLTQIERLPLVEATGKEQLGGAFRRLLSPALARSTVLIWAAFFLVMFGFYFVLSWTPRLLVSAGLSEQQGITGGVLLNVGGIFGTFIIGLLAAKFRLSRVLICYLLVNAVLLAVFVATTDYVQFAFGVVLLIGIFVNGCIAGIYALTPTLYGPSERVTGLGWGIGIGRSGAILSPLVAGKLIDANWAPAELYQLFSIAFVLAALAILLLRLPVTSAAPATVSATH